MKLQGLVGVGHSHHWIEGLFPLCYDAPDFFFVVWSKKGGTLVFLAEANAAFFLVDLGRLLLIDGKGCRVGLGEVLFDLMEDVALAEEVHFGISCAIYMSASVYITNLNIITSDLHRWKIGIGPNWLGRWYGWVEGKGRLDFQKRFDFFILPFLSYKMEMSFLPLLRLCLWRICLVVLLHQIKNLPVIRHII